MPRGVLSFFFKQDSTRDIRALVHQVLINWNHLMIPFFSKPPALSPAPVPSTIRRSTGQTKVELILGVTPPVSQMAICGVLTILARIAEFASQEDSQCANYL